MSEAVGEFLAHYASENYDPVKAHEYYLRNRELKGQTSTKGFSDTQREAWAYAKNKIGTDQKAESQSAQASQQARLDGLRNTAQQTRDRVRTQLQDLANRLKAQLEAPPPIDPPKLHTIPADASQKMKDYLTKQNQIMIGKYSTQVANAQAQKRASATAEKDQARKSAQEELQRVGNELKASLTKARDEYEASKKERDARYKSAADQEMQNIKTQLPGQAPKVGKARKGPAPKKPRAPRGSKKQQEDQQTLKT